MQASSNYKATNKLTDLSESADFLLSGGSGRRKQCLAASCMLEELPEMDFKELLTKAAAALGSAILTRNAACGRKRQHVAQRQSNQFEGISLST